MTIYRTIKRGTSLIGMLLVCTFLLGWADTWEDIQRASSKITSVSARFSQEKHMQILAKPLISRGRFYFQTPDSVRWEYTAPVRSVLLMHKGKIKRYTQGSKGFVEDRGGAVDSMQFILQEIGRWSKGRFNENEYFSATLKGGTGAHIILTPKEKGLAAMISRIVITPSPDRPGVLKSVTIVESEENYTLFEFTDSQLNAPIAESLFREVE
ncbi:MAG: outer membrane lipoprotein carrier protein LolA [Deltaproteobacteria bacterium]|nr:outer membrane lipoprotein carrier protein LolA [Deltaproteobacteria bacterium]